MKKIFPILIALFIFSGCGQKSVVVQNKNTAAENNNAKTAAPAEKIDTRKESDHVLILMFHYVRDVSRGNDPLGYNLSVSPAIFNEEMKWLKDNGYQTVPTRNISGKNIKEKDIVLSFDDGYADFYGIAWPILEKYGFSATIAIITDKISQPGYLTEQQIRELSEKGVEIASHSQSHPDLSKLEEAALKKEIKESKDYLENKFGIKISAVVYPSGKYNDAVLEKVSQSGYQIGLTTDPGIAKISDNLLSLPRIRIDNRDSLDGFIKKVTNNK